MLFIRPRLAILIVDDTTYKVHGFVPTYPLDKNYAYLKDDTVYPYWGKLGKKEKPTAPGIYKQNGDYIFIEHRTPEERAKYDKSNIQFPSLEMMFEDVNQNPEEFINVEDIEVINNNTEYWVPVIKDDDDFLKILIKRAIIDKKVSLRNYRDRLNNAYNLSNMKSALISDTKMSVPYFRQWCDALGLRFTMVIENSGQDRISVLPEPIVYNSEDSIF